LSREKSEKWFYDNIKNNVVFVRKLIVQGQEWPSDFLIINDGVTYFVEVKETQMKNAFTRSRMTQLRDMSRLERQDNVVCWWVLRFVEGCDSVWFVISSDSLLTAFEHCGKKSLNVDDLSDIFSVSPDLKCFF